MGAHIDFIGGNPNITRDIYSYFSVKFFQIESEVFSQVQEASNDQNGVNTGTMTWIPTEIPIEKCDTSRFGGTD